MIRGKHDHRVLHQIFLLHELEQHAKLVIDLFDKPHIGGDHRLARFFFRERAPANPLLEMLRERISVFAFFFRTMNRLNFCR